MTVVCIWPLLQSLFDPNFAPLILMNRLCETDKKRMVKGLYKRKFDKLWINVLYKLIKPFPGKPVNSQNTREGEKHVFRQKSWTKSNFQIVIQKCEKENVYFSNVF